MAKSVPVLSVLMSMIVCAFISCGGGGGSSGLSAGDQESFTADSVTFTMVYVPGGLTFPTGVNDDGTATVDDAYWIGETEVTYELWKKVYDWATDSARGINIYSFSHAGVKGNDGASGKEQHPVTTINWRDAMAWCNALTEWYNAQKGTSYTCAYYSDSGYTTPIRTSTNTAIIDPDAGGVDNPYVKSDATGFRLLSSNEWELAARWRDNATNTVSGYTNPSFTKGNSASGATTYYNDNTGGSGEPGKSANDVIAVYKYYWNGSSWIDNGTNSTAVVKSKGLGANTLGLYDMSGNVWEWCFDLSGSGRVSRGCSWFNNAYYLQVGSWNYFDPYDEYDNQGFRFARSAD